MKPAKRKAVEALGWQVGDAADFLEMSDDERQLLDARVELAMAIRRQRLAAHLSQKELGTRLKTSQPRVAKIERAAPDVSLDQLVRAFTAAGGRISFRSAPAEKSGRKRVAPAEIGTMLLKLAAK